MVKLYREDGGCVNWSEAEIAFVKKNYKIMSHKEMGDALNRTEKAVRNQCWKNGFVTDTSWSEEDVLLLKEFYEKAAGTAPLNLSKIAEVLGRNKTNVCRKARQLGLGTNQNRKSIPKPRKPKPQKKTERKKIVRTKGIGWHHTQETKDKISAGAKAAWANPDHVLNSDEIRQKRSDDMAARQRAGELRTGYSRGKQGKRPDVGNLYFRSSWEANYARYLNFLIAHKKVYKWQYEPDTFWFEEIKRGVRSYLPDFKIWDTETAEPYYVEVKGWMDAKSKTKLNRMRIYYPDIKVIVFGATEYKELSKSKALIPGWE